MKQLVLMYVFYDKNGDIKSISPMLDDHLASMFNVLTLPLEEVEMFLTAKRNTFDYQIKTVEKISGKTYKLIKKTVNIDYTRTLDNYLTKVENASLSNNILTITNIISKKCMSVKLNDGYKLAYTGNEGTEDQLEDMTNFFNTTSSIVYLTKKNNPYHLLFSFTFNPKELLTSDTLYFNYEDDFDSINTSVYTKKLISGYGYKKEA